jgi:hypothetical protein
MNAFYRIARFLLIHVYFRFGIARFWYLTYQAIWEPKSKRAPLKRFSSMENLAEYVSKLKWRADSWRELGDAVSAPTAVQWKAYHEPRSFIGDCDEFAVYLAAVLQSERHEHGFFDIRSAKLLTVMWNKTGGLEWEGNRNGLGGHNVCLIRYWDGGYAYMDYGMPSTRRDTIQEVVKDVRDAYAQVYGPFGWVVQDATTLKVEQTSLE